MKTRLTSVVGRGLPITLGLVLAIAVIVGAMTFAFLSSAPPTTLSMASGPDGSPFRAIAEQYRKILAREGVTLKVVASEGSRDNLAKLVDKRSAVDVALVAIGESTATEPARLVSLGSVSYEPLMVFYRGPLKTLVSEFKGLRLDVGPEGSEAFALSQKLFEMNGFAPNDETRVTHTSPEASIQALLGGRIDALFAMSDTTPTQLMKQLLRAPDIHLFNVVQADGYTRRITYLSRLVLPRGAIDFGEDIPAQDVSLIAPTVELVARESLHPALADLLLDAAREVHGRAGLYKKTGEFPAALAHEFPLSPDALRYYASGRGTFYRTFPFWVASLIERILAVVVPMAIILVPGIKIAPTIFQWRSESRIYRWYGLLQHIEQEAYGAPLDAANYERLLKRLEQVESSVMKLEVPSAYGDLLYDLRGHIDTVRARLSARAPRAE